MRLTTLSILVLMGFCTGVLPGQTPADPIQTLIQEVRQLRIAIERSSTIVPRLQVTLARFQSQQDRVDRLDREIRTLHSQMSTDATGREHMTATLARFDEQARQTQDVTQRKQLEDAAAGMRRELELQTQREQQARTQEADLVNQLKTEQARLAELSNQLDQLDRKMQER